MRGVLLTLLALLLAACAVPQRTTPVDFAADGRLALRGEIDGNKVAETANFRWRRSGERAEIELGSPLGDTQARLTFDPHGAELVDAKGNKRAAADAETLLYQATGYALPVSPLRWWIEGRTAPDWPTSDDETSDDGTRHFAQAGWQVSFGVPSPQYPKFIQLKRDALDVRIAITDWP